VYKREADGFDLARLLLAQQLAGAADLQIVGGQGEPDAQLASASIASRRFTASAVIALGCGVSR
jgi:hypothetical protein